MTRENRYQAAWNFAEQAVTLVRDIPAGISGPAGTYPAADVEQAAAVLFAQGYLIASDWREARSGDLWAELTPMSAHA